jgi:hypothetical protein
MHVQTHPHYNASPCHLMQVPLHCRTGKQGLSHDAASVLLDAGASAMWADVGAFTLLHSTLYDAYTLLQNADQVTLRILRTPCFDTVHHPRLHRVVSSSCRHQSCQWCQHTKHATKSTTEATILKACRLLSYFPTFLSIRSCVRVVIRTLPNACTCA